MLVNQLRSSLLRHPSSWTHSVAIRSSIRSVSELRPTRQNNLYRQLVESTVKNTRKIDSLDVYNQLKKTDIDEPNELRVIDVRETYEFNEESIEGTLYLSRGVLERDIESYIPNVSDPIILFCQNGERSSLAAESIKKLGYSNVSILKDGINGWKEEGLPLVKKSNTYADLQSN